MAAPSKFGRCLLLFAPLALVPAAFFAAIPWLKTVNPGVALSIAALVAVLVMGYANYISYRAMRRQDEVQKAGAGFAAQWGPPAGQAAFALLLLLPAFVDLSMGFTSALLSRFAGGGHMPVDRPVVMATLAVGFSALVLLQSLGTVVVQAVWWTAKR